MLKKIFKKEKGFTLVETLVAIFILVLSTTAPMVVAQNGLRAAYLARDQITAFYLAQDAMEFVKNVKDDKGLVILYDSIPNKSTWLDYLGDCKIKAQPLSGCTIDTLKGTNDGIEECPVGVGCLDSADPNSDSHLKYDSTSLAYGFSGSEESKFARTVSIEEVQVDREIKVTTRVRWKSNEGIGSREIDVIEYMTNWVGTLGDPDNN